VAIAAAAGRQPTAAGSGRAISLHT